MRRRSLAATLILLTVAVEAVRADDWPQFRGQQSDNTFRGETKLGEVEGLAVVWKRDLGSGYSGISVASGRAVTAFSDGTDDVIVAFDGDTGDELWRRSIGSTYRGHDGSHDGPISTPLIAGGRVFMLGPGGNLAAIDLASGDQIWSSHLAGDHGSMPPFFGFGTSPLLADGVVVVTSGSQAGPPGSPPGKGPSVLGLDPASGEVLWKTGQSPVTYQSPMTATVGGRRLVLAPTDFLLFGLEAESGEVVWQLPHGGELYPGPGTAAMNPVQLGGGRFFITDTPNSSSVVALAPGEDGQMALSRVWSGRSIRDTYTIPVYEKGHLYAYSSGFLTCVDAASGESVWRSRKPGDGFHILVDGHLAVMTKKGSFHVAAASSEGYREVTSLDLFETSWTPPSFSDGRFYVRGFDGIAAVEPRAAAAAAAPAPAAAAATTGFARFLAEVEGASDKTKVVEAFLAAQESFPVIEWDDSVSEAGSDRDLTVHFLYRGEADDMAITGDMIGAREVDAMTPVVGTDLFYYSTQLLSDARVSYHFIKDFEERLTDPLNPRKAPDMQGEVSWAGMPGWQAPTHLGEAPESRRGRVESLQIAVGPGVDGTGQDERSVDMYLPAGYDAEGERRYPVVYVHGGNLARLLGGWTRSLDNLIGVSVEPVLVAFIHTTGPPEVSFGAENAYSAMFAEAIVAHIDQRYRTLATVESRASVGADFSGYGALFSAFRHPGVVGRVATQSAFLLSMQLGILNQVVRPAEEHSPAIFVEWGTYDSRSRQEAWDYREGNRALVELLESRGYEVTAAEVPDGHGWTSWSNRNDKILEWLFPFAR